MSDYTSKSALVDSIMQNVVITTEEGLELRGEIVDLIKNQPTLDEKEIIRKAFERVVERLEERVQWYEVYGDCEGNSYRAYDHAIEIVKEECGISE